jgi:hypothetical protein
VQYNRVVKLNKNFENQLTLNSTSQSLLLLDLLSSPWVI